jgi:hypothetical protein
MYRIIGDMGNVIYGDTIAILPELQGRGYGKLFMKKFFDIADQQQADIAACSTAEGFPLYLKLGFQVIGHVKLDGKTIIGKNGSVIQIPELVVPIIRKPPQHTTQRVAKSVAANAGEPPIPANNHLRIAA